MTEKQYENRLRKLQELKAQIKVLEDQATVIETEIKRDMEQKHTEEFHAGDFLVRWKKLIQNRFDTTAFKKDHPEQYAEYVKPSEAWRFTVTA